MYHYKKQLAEAMAASVEQLEGPEAVSGLFEVPANSDMGDLSLPCFKLSKLMRKAPQQIAEDLKSACASAEFVERVDAVNGYLNFYWNRQRFAGNVLGQVLSQKENYGSSAAGEGRRIVIDYSSPNIAKPFHIGHLRSTMIGNALYQLFRFQGYECVGVNHLGDWGTQFGKLIVGYLRWGNEESVRDGGIDELLRLYIKFHDEAEEQPQLEDEARNWFVRLEQGDPEAEKLWQWFKEISLQEFNKIYSLLGVSFDSYAGESFYNDKTAAVVKELSEKGLLEEDDGAKLVRLDDYDMSPALILKKDGSTLYHTRDIAAAIYRKETYDFSKAIYVTGSPQSLHFKQWFKIIELMGCDWASDLHHVPFGQVSLEGAKLSTRKGNVVKLEELLNQAIQKTETLIEEKNPQLENKTEVARQVGVGAVIFNDLSTNRIKDTVFSWDEALNFDGETGPYVQYTHARACSLLRKAGDSALQVRSDLLYTEELFQVQQAYDVVKELSDFPDKIGQACEKLEPSLISRYLVDLSQEFNRFYHECPILVDDEQKRAERLAIVTAVKTVLQSGLHLIGMASPEKM